MPRPCGLGDAASFPAEPAQVLATAVLALVVHALRWAACSPTLELDYHESHSVDVVLFRTVRTEYYPVPCLKYALALLFRQIHRARRHGKPNTPDPWLTLWKICPGVRGTRRTSHGRLQHTVEMIDSQRDVKRRVNAVHGQARRDTTPLHTRLDLLRRDQEANC